MTHRLDPLLRPRTVAVIGASTREDSMGAWVLENLRRGGFRNSVFPVNPNYENIDGLRCFATLADLPERPELVIFAVGDSQLEAALDDAIKADVPAAVIMSTLIIDDDVEPVLRDRVQEKLKAAGMLVCGANGMGYYNVRDHVWACGFDSSTHDAPGNVAIISHSGSGMSGIIDSEERLQVNVAVSTGNELSVTMDEYLDFVLDLPETRTVGLFIETARSPEGLQKALSKAAQRRIPIVALKVGRSEESAKLAVSHSGALAGDDATYDALFDRYGVQRVNDQNEWTTALIMFAALHPLGEGGLVTLHDSGGERQLLIDLANDVGVPLTRLQAQTVRSLEEVLDPELPAVNPLDAWSRGGPGAGKVMTECLSLMMQDAGAALGAVVHDRAPYGKIYPSYLSYMQRARAESGKPVTLVSARQGTGHDDAAVTSTRAGYPVLDGVRSFLVGARLLFAYRDFLLRHTNELTELESDWDKTIVDLWQDRLRTADVLDEAESMAMLEDFGIATTRPVSASNIDDAIMAAANIGYPVALKTAKPGIIHKSEHSGVVLNIADEQQLRQGYVDVSEQLGPDVIVATMIETGEEFFLGVKRDPQFGPIVLLGFGGVHAETLADVVYAMPPFDAAHARCCIDRLQLRPILDGVRGRPAVDIDTLCGVASRFSLMVDSLRNVIAEIDVNPLIVTKSGATAVDALVVGRDRRENADA